MMRFEIALRCAVITALVVMAGCAGGKVLPVTSLPQAARTESGSTLLYVSEYSSNRVDVLSYPSGAPWETLSGFSAPNGICTDANGHVWVTDTLAQRIVEYAVGQTHRISVLHDPDEYPVDCAVDPTTGDLAVVNMYGSSSPSPGAGNVVIYRAARGKARAPYYDSLMYTMYFCGYDGNGDLFFDGASYGGGFRLAELPRRSNSILNLSLDRTIAEPGDIEPEGTTIALGDRQAHVIYQISVSGTQATVVGTTPLQRAGELEQFAFANGSVVGARGFRNRVSTWSYPAGGLPTATIRGFGTPIGVALASTTTNTRSRRIAAAHSIAPPIRRTALRSWMEPSARSGDLLYIADSYNSVVDVYSYPQAELVGTLGGFNLPQGECADSRGDVFVTNTNTSQVLEYEHGATQPVATLSDPHENPVGCAVDPKSGTLAVTNLTANGYGGSGSVALYKHAAGTPKLFFDPDIYFMFFCGFDDHGNLFVDGQHFGGGGKGFQLAELTPHASVFRNIVVPMLVNFPGGVQWDGRNVAVGDQGADVIYRLRVTGLASSLQGTTPLDGALDVVQFWQYKGTVIGPDNDAGDVGFWRYPAGGAAVKTITGFAGPEGATISLAPKSPIRINRPEKGARCGDSLKFLSDYNNGLVDVYRGAALCKVIYGLSNPNGIAVDAKGELYVAQGGSADVVVLKPPYNSVSATLADPGADPAGIALCNGYIAVTNLTSSTGVGSVVVYSGTASQPSYTLRDPNAAAEYSATCDPKGNLYTSYRNQSGTGSVNEWQAAQGNVIELGAITTGFPGGLRYQHGTLWVGDQETPTITVWPPPFQHPGETISLNGSDDPVDFVVHRSARQIDVADAALNEGIVFNLHGHKLETLPGNGGGLAVGVAYWARRR